MDNVTATLADFVSSASLATIPDAALHQAKRTFLNYIGCAVGGAWDDAVSVTVNALAVRGETTASMFGRGENYDFRLAALLNGISSAVYSFDDTHAEAVVHPGGPVGSALMALAQTRPISGADALLAYTLGVEVVCRVSKAVSVAPASAGLGWIQTGICGGIGAAVAVGKLLGFDAQRMAMAIGVAVSQASGTRGLSRSMCFSLMAGHAARSGLEAALMAEQGFISAADSLGTKFGFADIYADTPHLASVTEGLGRRYEIEANTFKPYPCGVVIHPAIDAVLDLLAKRTVAPAEIAQLELDVNPNTAKLSDIRHPQDSLEAQSSLRHWVAAAFVDRKAGVRQSRADKLNAPEISRLREMIVIRPNEAFARDATRLTVHLASGEVLTSAVDHCRGSQSRPMTDAEIEDKFRVQCADCLSPQDIDAIPPMIWSWQNIPDCSPIAERAKGKTR